MRRDGLDDTLMMHTHSLGFYITFFITSLTHPPVFKMKCASFCFFFWVLDHFPTIHLGHTQLMMMWAQQNPDAWTEGQTGNTHGG